MTSRASRWSSIGCWPRWPSFSARRPRHSRRMDSHALVFDLVRSRRHQLRMPVSLIVGFAEMLQEEAADRSWDALRPDLQRIRELGKDLTDLIIRTVDVVKLEAGGLKPAE